MFLCLFLHLCLSSDKIQQNLPGSIRKEAEELQFVDYDLVQMNLEADGRIDTTITFQTAVTGTRASRSYWKCLVKAVESSFKDCFAFGVALTFGSGGAVYTQQSCLYILESTFTSNKAVSGGSIACVNSRIDGEQATFSFDTAYHRAGSLYSISSDQISEIGSDGAVISPYNEISIIDSKFYMCQSNELYGAAYVYGSTNIYLHNVIFELCSAKAPCGAIAFSECTAFIDQCKFIGNSCNVLPDIPNEINIFKSKMINKEKGIPSGGGAIIFSCVDQSKQLTTQNCCFKQNVANYPNKNTFNSQSSIGNDILFQGNAKWRSFQDIFSTNQQDSIAIDDIKPSSLAISQWGTQFHVIDGVCITENDVLDLPIDTFSSTTNVEESSVNYDPINYDDNTEINQKPDPATTYPNTPNIIGYVSYTLHPHSPEIQFPTNAETAFVTPFETMVSTPFSTASSIPFSTAEQTNALTPVGTPFGTPFLTAFQTEKETPFTTNFMTPYMTNYETPFSTNFMTNYETPFSTAHTTPYVTVHKTPFSTNFMTNFQTPFSTASETPVGYIPPTPFETAFETPFNTVFKTAFETAHQTQFLSPFLIAHQTPFNTLHFTPIETPFKTAFSTEKPTDSPATEEKPIIIPTEEPPVIISIPEQTAPSPSPSENNNIREDTNTLEKNKFSIWPIVGAVIGLIILAALLIMFFIISKKHDVESDHLDWSDEKEATVLDDFNDVAVTTENLLYATSMLTEDDPDPFNKDFDDNDNDETPLNPPNDLFFI